MYAFGGGSAPVWYGGGVAGDCHDPTVTQFVAYTSLVITTRRYDWGVVSENTP